MQKKQLLFVNTRANWRVICGIAAILIMMLSFFLYENAFNSWLYYIGMFLLFVPLLIPYKRKSVVKYGKNWISFKLDKGSAYTIRPDKIKHIEVFTEKLVVWKSKKKFRKFDISSYDQRDVFLLVDLLQGRSFSESTTY